MTVTNIAFQLSEDNVESDLERQRGNMDVLPDYVVTDVEGTPPPLLLQVRYNVQMLTRMV